MTARKKHRGFNLIEAAIVLGVVGLVIGGIWVAAASVTYNKRLADVESMALTVRERVQALYKNLYPTPSSWGWQDVGIEMGRAGVIPQSFPTDFANSTRIFLPWKDSSMRIFVVNDITAGPRLMLRMMGLTSDVCIHLASFFGARYELYEISGITLSDGNILTLPSTPTSARTACVNAAWSGTTDFEIKFKI